jgi:hypothetical protein
MALTDVSKGRRKGNILHCAQGRSGNAGKTKKRSFHVLRYLNINKNINSLFNIHLKGTIYIIYFFNKLEKNLSLANHFCWFYLQQICTFIFCVNNSFSYHKRPRGNNRILVSERECRLLPSFFSNENSLLLLPLIPCKYFFYKNASELRLVACKS